MPKFTEPQKTGLRQKGRIKKRSLTIERPSIWTKIKEGKERLLKVIKLISIAALFSGLAYYFLSADGYFSCQTLTISGLETLKQEEVLEVLPPTLGKNLLLLPLKRIHKQVEAVRLVEKVAVSRIFPDKLKITIKERHPLAVAVVGGKNWAVDYQGIVLYPFKSSQLAEPIFITGLKGTEEEMTFKIRKAVELINWLKSFPESAAAVCEVNVASEETIKLYTFAAGLEVRLGNDYYQKHKWNYLLDFLARRSFTPEKLAYLDLRYRDIVVKPL